MRAALSAVMGFALMACAGAPPPPKPHEPEPRVAPAPADPCAFDDSAPEPGNVERVAAVCFASSVKAIPLRSDPERLKGLVTTVAGGAYSTGLVSGDLQKLFATGLFDDVSAVAAGSPNGAIVRFELAERKPVEATRVLGVTKQRADEILDTVVGHEAMVLDVNRLRRATSALKEDYRERGFLRAEVDYSVADAPGGATITINVKEGARAEVRSLTFSGLKTLREAMFSADILNKPKSSYQPAAIARDQMAIDAACYDHGLLTAKVTPPTIQEAKDGSTVDVAWTIEEGPVYRISKIELDGDLRGDKAALEKLLTSKSGDVFVRKKLVDAIQAMRDRRRARKEPDEIDPMTDIDPKKHTVHITLRFAR